MENWYLITSESYDNPYIKKFPMWSLGNTHALISSSADYGGLYSQSFDSYDSMMGWMYDPTTKEEKKWNGYYEDPDNDLYGIDGPFPEEMDETTI